MFRLITLLNRVVLLYRSSNSKIWLRILTLILVGLASISNSDLLAQTKIELNEVIIESEQKVSDRVIENESVEDLILLSRMEVRHAGSRGVGEILKRLPGIVVQGPPMAYRNAKIFGLDKQYQSILIDGHRPAGGEDRREFKLDRMPASLIEGVELVYNPNVKFGGSSPAGIINLKTFDVPDGRLFGVDLGLDHSNTYPGVYPEGSFYYGDRNAKSGYFIYLGRSQYVRKDRVNMSDQESDITGALFEVSTVKLNTGLARFTYTPNAKNNLSFKIYWSDQYQKEDLKSDVSRRSQGGLSFRRDSSSEESRQTLLMTELKHIIKTGNLTGTSRLVYDWSGLVKEKNRLREKDPDWEKSLELEEQKLNLLKVRSDWASTMRIWKGLGHSQSFGIDGNLNLRDFRRMAFLKISDHLFWDESENGSFNLSEANLAMYGLEDISYRNSKISVGARIEQNFLSYSTIDTSGFEQYLSFLPSFHGRHELFSPDWILRWGISRQNALQPFQYMVPVKKVKHKKEVIEMGNPNLLPGKSWNYQIKVQRSFSENSRVSIGGIYTSIKDVVEMKYLGIDDDFNYRVFQPMNIDSATIVSTSFEGIVDLADFTLVPLRIWGNAGMNTSRVRDPGSGEIRRLNDQAQFQTSLNLDYLLSLYKLRFSIGYTWVGERHTYDTFSADGTFSPGFHYAPFGQLDCSIKYYFTRWGYLSMSIHNLFDHRETLYQDQIIEETIPGRLIRLGLSLSFN